MPLKVEAGLRERIVSNYAQITEKIEPEDLLHVLSQPPEIFLAEGDQNSIFYQTNEIRNRQEYKTEMINNVVNRILLAPQGNLSYQDNVYVTNILHKLGIKDEKTFLKELYQSFEDNRQIYARMNTLLHRSENQYQTIMQEEAGKVQETGQTQEEEMPSREQVLYLHQQVMNRLQTGDIYQEMRAYWNSQINHQEINTRQLLMSDQVRIANQLTLMKESKEHRPVNLYYHHENIYEEEITDTQMEEHSLTQTLSSAALFNLIENIYQQRLEKNQTSGAIWQQMSQAFYRSEENLLQRIEENLYSDARKLFRQELNLTELEEYLLHTPRQEERERIAPAILRQFTNTILENEALDQEAMAPVPEEEDRPDLPPAEITNIENRTEENIVERMESMRIENEQRINQYQNILNTIQRREVPAQAVSPEEIKAKTILESRRFLQEPEKILEQMEEAKKPHEAKESEEDQKILQALPTEIRNRMELLYRIQRGELPSADMVQGEEAMKVLASQVQETMVIERERQQRLLRQQAENREETARTIEEIRQQTPDLVHEILQENKEIKLVHKVQESLNQEEILEQLEEQRCLINSRKETREEHRENTTKVINTEATRTIVKEEVQNIDFNKIVQDSVSRELEGLEDQIFNSLEYRLEDERKRRGF